MIPRLHPLALFASLALAGATACAQLPKRQGASVETKSNPKLEQESPIDIAVLPVENLSGSKRVPSKDLRTALEGGLVVRRYTPLATDYVDSQIVDAAFKPGSLREDAQLTLKVEAWDDSLWDTHTSVTLKLSARLVDSKSGGELWSAKLDRRFDLGQDRERYSSDAPLKKLLCEMVVSELLSALPARTARPGRAN